MSAETIGQIEQQLAQLVNSTDSETGKIMKMIIGKDIIITQLATDLKREISKSYELTEEIKKLNEKIASNEKVLETPDETPTTKND